MVVGSETEVKWVFGGERGGESKVGVGMGVEVELVGLVLMAVEWEEAEEEIAWWV